MYVGLGARLQIQARAPDFHENSARASELFIFDRKLLFMDPHLVKSCTFWVKTLILQVSRLHSRDV